MPKISLIVSTLGRTTQLERLLQSLRRQHYTDFEVIIVDQNDDARLQPVLASHQQALRLVCTRSERGLSRGRNTGLEHAQGEVVAFPDDDCWYPPDLLGRIAELFERHSDIDVFSGKTVDAHFVESLCVFHTSARKITRGNVWRAGNSNTIFVRAGRGEKLRFNESLGVGAFTRFQSGEETDFLLRLLSAGANLQYDPEILVHHDQVDPRDPSAGLRRARAYAPGLGRVLRLHRFRADQVLWFAVRPVGRACLAALTGDAALAKYKWSWASGVVSGYLDGDARTSHAPSPGGSPSR